MTGRSPTWCSTCCTQHGRLEECPGELVAVEEERNGWRVTVVTPHGLQTMGVRVADTGGVWRARILTFPNILWAVPDGRGTIKFVGGSPQEAEQRAAEFIRMHCRAKGFTIWKRAADVVPAALDRDAEDSPLAPPAGGPAPRRIRYLPVRFGVAGPSESGRTGDLSSTGLFVITDSPVPTGRFVELLLYVDRAPTNEAGHEKTPPVPMRGMVRWARTNHKTGRAPGMGIQIATPPASYVEFVRALR